uniref:MBL fold metallo-hydrolase n=1 Tax=Hydatigena taeniaeformis TaxID=6205 RepID=A0A0R3WU84_HYDTA
LRLGIHQVGHTAEYEGSDGKTEWAGFADEDEGGE